MATKKTANAEQENEETTVGAAADKKTKQTVKYPPYVYAYGSIPKLFEEIRKASVPPKFTQDFMESMLGLKSSSHRALIPLLKKLGFLDAANVPTEAYKNYRDPSQAEAVMADQIRSAYADVYRASEYAHTLPKEQLAAKVRLLTGAAEDDGNIGPVVGTFLELKKLADFDTTDSRPRTPVAEPRKEAELSEPAIRVGRHPAPLGLSYTINLNLPATTEIEVFNSIFRSLKEHLLDGR